MSTNKKSHKQIIQYSLNEYYSAIQNDHQKYEMWENAYNFQPQKWDTEVMFTMSTHPLMTT